MSQNVKVKICGLRRPEDIELANRLKPDYVGFVFVLKKREVTDEQAAELGAGLDPSIKKVGVFLDTDINRVIKLLKEGIIDIAQLHGNESEEYVQRVKEETGKPVINVRILSKNEGDMKEFLKTSADMLLLDSGTGSGVALDWNCMPGNDIIGKDYFLAGGLSPENVTDALSRLKAAKALPYAVDVSSKVETDMYKDPLKVEKFINAVRSWNENN